MEEFLTLADDEAECLNLLDLPNYQPEVPIFVRPMSDNVNAKAATMNVNHLPKTGKNKDKEYYGVQTVRGWDLMTHGGFVTYPHHDASGLCTYMNVRSGTRIWAYIDTATDTPKGTGTSALFSEWDTLFLGSCMSQDADLPIGTLLLARGDTLIQPPGSKYMVYTPQNGMTSGGHFISYSTLHLTELALRYDSSEVPGKDAKYERDALSTNATHPSVHRYITWMVIGLPVLAQDTSRTFYRRPLVALIALSEGARMYISEEEDNVTPYLKEILGEEEHAGRIVATLKSGLKVSDAVEELEKGEWWDRGPVCNLKSMLAKLV
ncbi:hypothetical protein JVT61DRAFT_14261 [Boletus reticuloceps]|uniref:JmjC domain-containing protein n=1 Tax=Boletus reticuloceps TaxID=495285 RepID=A0A8I3A374_9AGAM|nr:hypothetical protein JVT61DRAFT_14261 [Boletus reticuloceps]